MNCSARALDTDTGSCESLTKDRVRCESAADPVGRPCQWNGARCLSIRTGRCSRPTLCYQVRTEGGSDCGDRTGYEACTQHTDARGMLCGWKDKERPALESRDGRRPSEWKLLAFEEVSGCSS